MDKYNSIARKKNVGLSTLEDEVFGHSNIGTTLQHKKRVVLLGVATQMTSLYYIV